VWGSLVLGLASITTADPWLLIGWFLGQTAELGIAGGFAGSAFAGSKLTRLFGGALILIVVCLVITIVLQSTGLAPQIKSS
jgi:hypothetical protein